MDILTDWRAREALATRRAEARVAEAKTKLCEALGTLGVVAATVSYSGEGDSGDVDSVTLQIDDDPQGARQAAALAQTIVLNVETHEFDETAQQWVGRSAPKPMTVQDALREFCWDLIKVHDHDGFENNDGGSGEITLTIATRSYTYEHRDYFTSSESYDHEG
jgi:hypothetical protein